MTFHFRLGAQTEANDLVKRFHYSRRVPSNVQMVATLHGSGGLYGDYGEAVAACFFSIPPTRWSEDVWELSRLVRHPDHRPHLTSLISQAIKWIRRQGKIDLVVSFADWTQRHHGGIYQAAGWRYAGARDRRMDGCIVDGKFWPGRSCNSRWGTRSPTKLADILGRSVEPHYDEGKHLYWLPVFRSGERKARGLGLASLPYPKPNAARPSDAPIPIGVSEAQPLGAAP